MTLKNYSGESTAGSDMVATVALTSFVLTKKINLKHECVFPVPVITQDSFMFTTITTCRHNLLSGRFINYTADVKNF